MNPHLEIKIESIAAIQWTKSAVIAADFLQIFRLSSGQLSQLIMNQTDSAWLLIKRKTVAKMILISIW